MQRGKVNPYLRELCRQIVDGNVENERFAWLLIESGVQVESYEWNVVNRLVYEGDEMQKRATKFGRAMH